MIETSEVSSMASINMSIRTDSELKAQAEAVLSQLGMTMNGTINMFLHQIVRDQAVPLSLSLSSEHSVYADLLYAQTERARGYQGRNARAILDDMDKIIADAEEAGK
jgi:DNA-damage-inducible protein J